MREGIRGPFKEGKMCCRKENDLGESIPKRGFRKQVTPYFWIDSPRFDFEQRFVVSNKRNIL